MKVLKLFLILPLLAMTSAAFAGNLASGTVEIDSKLEKKAAGIRTLFITIYDLESKRPMPYGATKVVLKADAKGSFHKFVLNEKNVRVMMKAATPKKMRIKARLDKDGSAGMDQPGDLTGEIKPVAVGSKGLKIKINTAK